MELWVMTWTWDGDTQAPKVFHNCWAAQREFYAWVSDKDADGNLVEWKDVCTPEQCNTVWWLKNDEYDIQFFLTEVL